MFTHLSSKIIFSCMYITNQEKHICIIGIKTDKGDISEMNTCIAFCFGREHAVHEQLRSFIAVLTTTKLVDDDSA